MKMELSKLQARLGEMKEYVHKLKLESQNVSGREEDCKQMILAKE
jgi:hypothetical protein